MSPHEEQRHNMGFVLPTPVRCVSSREGTRVPGKCLLRATAIKPEESTTVKTGPESGKLTPDWAGDTQLSKLVNALIGAPVLSSVLKMGARRVIINTAEDKGIPWRQRSTELGQLLPESQRAEILASIQDPDLQYPQYYLRPFHAYDRGNLGWLQAFEVASATKSMCIRTFRSEAVLPDHVTAFDRMHANVFDAIVTNAPEGWVDRRAFAALDVGCGVGISTRDLARRLLAHGVDVARVEGIDPSPYFLAVASVDAAPLGTDRTDVEHLVSFRHALGERTHVSDETLDLFTIQLTTHELPTYATRAIVEEAFRTLKPNSVFALFDNDPKSPIIQNLSPVLFTLMKSTEPFLDEYFALDVEQLLKDIGFVNVKYVRTDPRHRTIVATKP